MLFPIKSAEMVCRIRFTDFVFMAHLDVLYYYNISRREGIGNARYGGNFMYAAYPSWLRHLVYQHIKL